MKITRTYPQPDSPQPFIGPRERAMGVFKYLLDMEPEAAVKHPRFALIKHAFDVADRTGWNAACSMIEHGNTPLPSIIEPSVAELLTGSTDAPDPEVKPFIGEPRAFPGLSGNPAHIGRCLPPDDFGDE